MQIQSVTSYNYTKTYQPSYKAHIKYSQINKVINKNNCTKVGMVGLLSTITAKLLSKKSTENNNENSIISEIDKKKLFEKDKEGNFEELCGEKVIEQLKDKPELLAQWFLNTNNYGVNYFGLGVGAEEPRIKRANKMHKALKSQPDVLYEIYMTPTHSHRNQNGTFTYVTTPICRFPNDKKYIKTVLKNVIDLATNSDLSLLRSKKLLEHYKYDAKYIDNAIEKKFEQLIKCIDLAIKQQKISDDSSKYLCAKGVEKYLHSDEEIQSMWKYREPIDVDDTDSIFGKNEMRRIMHEADALLPPEPSIFEEIFGDNDYDDISQNSNKIRDKEKETRISEQKEKERNRRIIEFYEPDNDSWLDEVFQKM